MGNCGIVKLRVFNLSLLFLTNLSWGYCRYSPNDYFLKKLIEEWCEGVIQDNNRNQGIIGQCGSGKKTDIEQPQSLLLEKVAVHLHKDVRRNLVIDVRGLTKVQLTID